MDQWCRICAVITEDLGSTLGTFLTVYTNVCNSRSSRSNALFKNEKCSTGNSRNKY